MNGDHRLKPFPPCDPEKLASHEQQVAREELALPKTETEQLHHDRKLNLHLLTTADEIHDWDSAQAIALRLTNIYRRLELCRQEEFANSNRER